jgi:phosphoribosylglycinamide formyltransferase 2
VILAEQPSRSFQFRDVSAALELGAAETTVDLRLFGKPETLSGRRMGVALARAASINKAVATAKAAAASVIISYDKES